MRENLLFIILFFGAIGAFFSASSLVFFDNSHQANVLDNVRDFLKNTFDFQSNLLPSTNQAEPAKEDISLYKPVIDYEQAVVKAVETAEPSVVSIVISKDLPVIEQCPGSNPFGDLPPEFQDFFGNGGFSFSQPCQKGTAKQEVGGGSGFIVSADGLVVTNKHVVYDEKADYTVLTNDGKKYPARVLARDASQDLAVLKIDVSGLKPVTLGDSQSVKLGQTAIAIGNSLGEFRNTVSVGVISGLARTITANGGDFGSEKITGVLQTDAAINPGNSGGPLLNLKGEVIAINTAIASGAQNIGFAIPINSVKRAINSVKQTGEIKTSYIGVRYTIIDEDLAKSQKLGSTEGALLRGGSDGPAVVSGSPAAKAGLQAEDIILEVNGQKIDADHPLLAVIQNFNIGETVAIKVLRGDQKLNLNLKISERPKS